MVTTEYKTHAHLLYHGQEGEQNNMNVATEEKSPVFFFGGECFTAALTEDKTRYGSRQTTNERVRKKLKIKIK